MVLPSDADRQALLAALLRHRVQFVLIGGAAAQTRGWSRLTEDVDVTPAQDTANLKRLCAALRELEADLSGGRPRSPDEPRTPPDYWSPETLRAVGVWNTHTRHGRLDVTLQPTGTGGYGDLHRAATSEQVAQTQVAVLVAAGADIVRSKTQADRAKDRDALPQLRRELIDAGALDAAQASGPIAPSTRPGDPTQAPVPGAYLEQALGPRPQRAPDAALWDRAAQRIEAYRTRWGITDPERALGDPPTGGQQLPQFHLERGALQTNARRLHTHRGQHHDRDR